LLPDRGRDDALLPRHAAAPPADHAGHDLQRGRHDRAQERARLSPEAGHEGPVRGAARAMNLKRLTQEGAKSASEWLKPHFRVITLDGERKGFRLETIFW